MDQIIRILEKLNMPRSSITVTLADFMPLSLTETRRKTTGRLSREEAQLLHRAARKEQQNNILYTARTLTRANPLLRKEMGAARYRGVTPYGYGDIIAPRADEFAAPGAVSSMFSPAGYLTELYREARNLHKKDSPRNLDKRRPDLKKLVLSQENQDNEISTLALANDQLEAALMHLSELTEKTKYDEILATSRNSGVTPYNTPLELTREALAQQNFSLPAHVLGKGAESAAQLALTAGISPELYAILTEKTAGLSDDETDALLKKNFPCVNPQNLMNLDALANYYELPRDDIQAFVAGETADKSQTPDVYINNKLVIPAITADRKITLSELTRTPDGKTQANYIDLIPQGGNQFLVNFSMPSASSDYPIFRIGTHSGSSSDLYSDPDFVPEPNQHYSVTVTFDADRLKQSVEIGISRVKPSTGSYHYTSANFTCTDAKPGAWLLSMNKHLRLAKACGLSPLETQRALNRLRISKDDTETTVLHRFTEALHYCKRYSTDTETALMLCNADISRRSYNGQLSQFDRLFNHPPLNGVTYTLDGDAIPMLPDADDPRREVLKRTFRVDNTGLWQLFDITARDDGDKKTRNNIENLSDLLLVRLLADVHNLTVTQLDTLLRVSPYRTTNVYEITEQKRRELINFLYQSTQWLNTQSVTTEQLFALLTTAAPAIPGKEMNTLLDALRNGDIDSNALHTTMAPVIAAAMQLETWEQGEALLHWLDNNHPDNVPVTKDIWPLIAAKDPSADQQKTLAAWCQALAQRVLVIRTFAISHAELKILSQGAPADTLAALREISEFHNLINRCGEQAGTVLDALQSNTLTVTVLAGSLGLSEHVITQALTQAGQSTTLTGWTQLAALPSRLDLADKLHITPKDITNLLTVSENVSPSYTELATLAGLLQAGLNETQTKQLQTRSEQRRSEALSGEYRVLIMNKPRANRDDIWRELLIDGKVSAEITTTRLADAIAGIQLYINRTIAGDEPGADSAVLERQFFKDWDTYNKRYSTWAGVSQLVYYPENTIDPTIRMGQTGMMNTMLEQLSQSELSSDTLENAFRQYLTAFEQIANLTVISGYHDTVSIDEGNTWFIGTSQTAPKKYYWRKADHSKCQNGRFAANAWSDWKEITCAVNPYKDMVRPVIYRSRLYLLWVEEQKRKDEDGKKDISVFSVKLTHIKYDGSWASPFSYDVTGNLPSTSEIPGLYCSASRDDNTLTIICYEKNADNTKTPTSYFGLRIQQDMAATNAADISTILGNIRPQLDTVSVVRVNTLLSGRYHTEFSLISQEGNKTPDLNLAPGNYTFIKNDQGSRLTLNPTAYMTLDPDNIFDSVHPVIRDYLIQYLNEYGYTLYTPESIEYRPLNSDFPEGDVRFAVLEYDGGGSSKYTKAFMTIKSKKYGDKPNSFAFHDSPDEWADGLLEIYSEESYIAGYGPSADSYVNELSHDVTKYLLNTDSTTPGAELTTGKLLKRAEPLSTGNIRIDFLHDGQIFNTIKGSDTGMKITGYPDSSAETLPFAFGSLSLDLPGNDDKQTITINVSYTGTDPLNAVTRYQLTLETPKISKSVISLYTTADGAQYMEWDAYRTRLNTLFARQLIERANNGIDAVLSPETQNLREPKPGQGTYVTLTLKPYDKAIHGDNRTFTIYYHSALAEGEHFPVASGTLSTTQNTEVKLFIPRLDASYGDLDKLYFHAKFARGISATNRLNRTDDDNPDGWFFDESYSKYFDGLESVSGLAQPDEPMDFSGANALYFWELFYYTPMMVAMRLLQEQNFTESNRWLSYIWQPAASGRGDWRVRPLKEDTSWNADPLDSVDPDAVAQNDPMHYKVSTLMKLLDLLIARGDSAYRIPERDTLNEAKMWYMQALELLGDKPLTLTGDNWHNPSLSDAADQSKTRQFHDDISHVRSGGLLPEVRTANTLTGLFLPQQNEKLLGYWQTLEMRLFNLRNNLSIDGQPLSLPIFAAPADPAALLSAAAAASGGSKALPSADHIPSMRFPQALESARSLTGQLMQFGATLQGLIERQDAEAMSELLQNQAGELMLSSLRMQEQTLAELDAEKKTLEQSRAGAQSRFDSYRSLYDEDVSAAEQRTMDLYLSSSILNTSAEALAMAEAVADMVPNVFGMAVGGSRWGGVPKAIGSGIALAATATKITADNISQSEVWRRRRQEWEIQKNNAESEVKQIDAQLEALTVRRTATEMQREHLALQQAQTQAQLEFLQRKFSNKALYSWLRGRLAAIYYRFYDLTAARCMMAEAAYGWQTGETTRYIKPGAWQSSNAGLMAGESLLLNLTEMEQAWLKWDRRALEVTRTVSLAEVYSADKVNLADKIADLLKGSGSGDTPASTGLSMTTDKQLHAAFNLKSLNIADDYPVNLGKTRRIKQISVTLPALTGPYQDVRAVLHCGNTIKLSDKQEVQLPKGSTAIAVSHGMNDDGQFRLDFSDGRWLPFEGIPVDNDNSLTLSFPGATGDKQKALLLSLSDIIIHIRYTIR